MRNLVVQRDACAVLGVASDDGRVTDFCIDPTEGRLYAVTEEAVVLCFAVDQPSAVSRRLVVAAAAGHTTWAPPVSLTRPSRPTKA